MTNCSTFADLKKLVDTTLGKPLPTRKRLMESGVPIVAETDTLTVYQNGFYIYTDGEHSTVYRVDACSKLGFKKLRVADDMRGEAEETVYVDETYYADYPWQFALELAGDFRLEHNSDVREDDHSQISLIDETAEINAMGTKSENGVHHQSRMPQYNMEEEIVEAMDHQAKLALLPAAKQVLKGTERRVIELYYDAVPRTEEEVADIIGISQQAVHKSKAKALDKLKKFYEESGC